MVLAEYAAANGQPQRAEPALRQVSAEEASPERAGAALQRLAKLYETEGLGRRSAMHLALAGHRSQAARQPLDSKALFDAAAHAYARRSPALCALWAGRDRAGQRWGGFARGTVGWPALEEHLHLALVEHAQRRVGGMGWDGMIYLCIVGHMPPVSVLQSPFRCDASTPLLILLSDATLAYRLPLQCWGPGVSDSTPGRAPGMRPPDEGIGDRPPAVLGRPGGDRQVRMGAVLILRWWRQASEDKK